VVSLLFTAGHSTHADYQILQSSDGPSVISTGPPFQSTLPFTPWKHEGEEISVLVDVKVGQEGKVSNAHAVNCWIKYFCQEAEMSARQWQFAPFKLASESSDVRTVILTFVFRAEVHSEDKEESVASVFIPPYRMEVVYKKIAPLDIILLPRIDGKIPVEKCEAHGEILQLDIISVSYGLVAFDPKSYEEYWDARHRLFPHSNLWMNGGCVEGPERAEVLYCQKCRDAETKWQREHRAP
jgi:hypothetical protein